MNGEHSQDPQHREQRRAPGGLPEGLREAREIVVTARFLGERIDLPRLAKRTLGEPLDGERTWAGRATVGTRPLCLALENSQLLILFRYGVAVWFRPVGQQTGPSQTGPSQTGPSQIGPFALGLPEPVLPAELAALVSGWHSVPETETLAVRRVSQGADRVEPAAICLRQLTVERFQLIAWVLAQSVTLAEYESRVSQNFDHVEPFAAELQAHGRGGRRMKNLLQQIGNVLLTEHKLVARVEVREKPELLWEHADLEPLYFQLEHEFEIGERYTALERKLALTARTVTTLLELLQNQRTLRVEWYIVILIVLEIVLTCYELFWRAH